MGKYGKCFPCRERESNCKVSQTEIILAGLQIRSYASISRGELARRTEVVGDEIREEGHAAMEMLFSQFVLKPLNIVKQENNAD